MCRSSYSGLESGTFLVASKTLKVEKLMTMNRQMYFAFFYLSFVAFLWPLLQEFQEISLIDFTYAGAIFLVIVAIEFSVLLVFSLFIKVLQYVRLKELIVKGIFQIQIVMVSFFVALNIYYFCFTLVTMKGNLSTNLAWALVPLLFIILSRSSLTRLLILFSTIFLILSLVQFLYSFTAEKVDNVQANENWKFEKQQALFSLKEKPERRNIYMISFDSVVSPKSLRTFYGQTDAKHFDSLRSAGFNVLDSAFSGGDKTRSSFYNLMKLDENPRLVLGFYSTRSLNPSYVLFEKTGYKVQFMFNSNYLGSNSNTLDYFYPEEKTVTLCDFIDQTYGIIACNTQVLFGIVPKYFGEIFLSPEQYFAKILERIKVINTNDTLDERWVTIAHIWYPGHAPLDYVYTDLAGKEQYIEKMFNAYPKLDEMIQQVVSTIKEVDDDPIIFIYSDHGAWLTKGLDYGEENSMYSKDEIYLEKTGIIFSVYPADFCDTKFIEGYNTKFLINDMLECENNR